MIKLVENGELEIDANGRVWRLKCRKGKRNGGFGFYKVKRRRAETKLPNGYLQIRGMINLERFYGNASRLVWQNLYGDIQYGMVVNHKNGIKDDNRPDNLEIVTMSENMKHAYRNGLKNQDGQKNPNAKLSDKQVAEIRLVYAAGGYTLKDLAGKYGVTFQHISVVVRGDSRPKQGGKTADYSHRRTEGNRHRNKKTGRFEKGNLWDQTPKAKT